MPEGPANLGYFVSKDQPRKNADNVCVLVVHYNFKNAKDESWIREGDAQDVENLDKTFRVNRNCNFCSWLSPEKGELLQLLSDHEKLLGKFGCTDVPSVFMLYILSHGDRDGKIFTDHYQKEDPNDFICFTTAEIFESLKMLTVFEDCLKLINFGPCRGELIDEIFYANDEDFKNENSCRITYSPMIRNMVMFFSTVETTKAKRDQKGTTFALLTCQVLNSLEKDENLINVLTTIQYESHKIAGKEKNGQTPEVKMFSQDKTFVFSKTSKDCSSLSTFEATRFKVKRKREFYSWKSSSGENLRHRLAFLISAKPNEQFKEIKRALSRNLDFETRERMLRGNPWVSINEASRIDSDIGCIFLIFFGQVSENKVTNEVCVEVDSKEIAVSEILLKFIGPKNDQWIGKPKILFLVNQETSSFDNIGSRQSNMEISATNHSGWLVLVLHSKDGLQKLIEIFKGQELKKEKSLQELLASLLISNSTENRDLLNSTLQYLLNFPDWPRSFVKLNLLVTDSQKNQENHVCFDSLVEDTARKKQIWLLSSVAGSGKTTILRELAFQFGKQNPELKILRISLPRVSFRSLKRNMSAIEFLENVTHNSHDEITKSIESKQCVVILDGFDEIRPVNQKNILNVIEALQKKQISVWIGTRPNAAEAIHERIPRAVLVKIDPLNEEQQMELLKLEAGKSEDECELFIRNFKSKDILQNPLHLSLVAKYDVEGNLYQIYKQVVQQKVEDTLIKEGFDRNNENTFPGKLKVALESLQDIASCHIRGVELIGGNRKDLGKINYYGIATFENHEVIFIHQTFAEFLAAQHFLHEIEDIGECSQISSEDSASVIYAESFLWCRRFVDLFYSTVLNDEKKIEEHRASILPVIRLNPDDFLRLIVADDCINIFTMIYQIISFNNIPEDNRISVVKDKTLLFSAIELAEDISIKMLDTNMIESDEELLTILPYLLKLVAEENACLFFKELMEKFPRLPEMINSRRLLIDARQFAATHNNGEMLELLLQSGVDIDPVETRTSILVEEIGVDARAKDNQGHTALRIAVDKGKKCVNYVITKDINLDFKNKGGQTCLHLAAGRGDLEALQTWIELGGDLDVVDEDGLTALHYAAGGGHLPFVEKLIACAAKEDEHPDIDESSVGSIIKEMVKKCDNKGRTAVHHAAKSKNVDLMKMLLENNADLTQTDLEGKNAIHHAIKDESMLRFIIEKNGDLVKQRTNDGNTTLHTALLSFRYGDSDRIALWIIEQLDDIFLNAKNDFGDTPLLLARKKGLLSVTELLLTRNVDVNVSDTRGRTAMHYAAERGNLDLVKLLYDKGAVLTLTDDKGMNALHCANWNFTTFLFLHEKNNDLLKQRAKNGDTTLHLALRFAYEYPVENIRWLLEQCENDLNVTNNVGETPLLLACKERKWIFAKFLLSKCVDIDVKDRNGRTALHYAVHLNNSETEDNSHAFDVVQELRKRGADLAQTDNEGMNAFHHAIGNYNMALFIHELNGDLVNQRLKNGDTTLHLVNRLDKYHSDDRVLIWLLKLCGNDLKVKLKVK